MDAQISSRAGRLADILIWGGTCVAFVALLGMGLHVVYSLLATFPDGGPVGLSPVWLAGIGAGTALGLIGAAITADRPDPVEEAVEQPRSPARAA